MQRPALGFIGMGKVGMTLARLLSDRGFVIAAIYSRHPQQRKPFADALDAKMATSLAEVASLADLIFLTVPDDAISEVIAALGAVDLSGKAVVHTSGVHEADILDTLAARGAIIGSLHPIFPFADVEQSVKGLPGAVFGLQAESLLLRDWLNAIVGTLDGQSLVIGMGQKALYHSALVFASNYGVTLYAIAQRLLASMGGEKEVSSAALDTLVGEMVRNLQVMGIPDALTGPLVRGDAGTVEAHLTALHGFDPAVEELYRLLAIQTLPLATARGVDTGFIATLLRKKMDDAANHT